MTVPNYLFTQLSYHQSAHPTHSPAHLWSIHQCRNSSVFGRRPSPAFNEERPCASALPIGLFYLAVQLHPFLVLGFPPTSPSGHGRTYATHGRSRPVHAAEPSRHGRRPTDGYEQLCLSVHSEQLNRNWSWLASQCPDRRASALGTRIVSHPATWFFNSPLLCGNIPYCVGRISILDRKKIAMPG